MSGQISNLDLCFDGLVSSRQFIDRDGSGLAAGQIVAGALGRQKPGHRVTIHVISRANSENVGKLFEHHQAKLIDAQQSVTRILIAHAHRYVFVRRPVIQCKDNQRLQCWRCERPADDPGTSSACDSPGRCARWRDRWARVRFDRRCSAIQGKWFARETLSAFHSCRGQVCPGHPKPEAQPYDNSRTTPTS